MKEKQTLSYKELLCEKNYIKIFISSIISRFGDSIDALAFSWMVYDITGSASWLALIFGVNALPSIIFQPFAGALVENMNKKKVMVFTDLGRGFVVMITAALLFLGYLKPWMLFIFTFLNSTLEAFNIPSGLAIFPKILPREKYSCGKALSGSAMRIAEIAGMGAAGAIVGFSGTAAALFIDAVTFIAAGTIEFTLSLNKEDVASNSSSFDDFKENLIEGFKYFKEKKMVFNVCIIGSFLCVLMVPFNTMQTAYIRDTLHLNAEALSAAGIILTLGLSIGAYFYPKLNKVMSRKQILILGGLSLSIAYIMLCLIPALSSNLYILIALSIAMAVLGIGFGFMNVAMNVAFMLHVEESYMARVGGLFNSMASAMVPLSSFVIAGIISSISITALFTGSAILTAAVFILSGFNKSLSEL